jgi:hypothetical protein
MNEHDEHDVDQQDELAGTPEAPPVPDVEGAFVEYRPGHWLRAGRIVEVSEANVRSPSTDESCTLGPGRLARSRLHLWKDDADGWGSVLSTATVRQVLAAIRLAEHAADLRRLEALARLLGVYAARAR